jgi:hypothetical protein
MKSTLAFCVLLLGLSVEHAEAGRRVTVVIDTDPPGAAIYQSDQHMGVSPLELKYDVPSRWKACQLLQPLRARWVSGAETPATDIQVCPQQGTKQSVSFMRPTGVDGTDIDAMYAAQLQQIDVLRREMRRAADLQFILAMREQRAQVQQAQQANLLQLQQSLNLIQQNTLQRQRVLTLQRNLNCTSQVVGNIVYTSCQ